MKRKAEKQDAELRSAEYSEGQPGIIERLPESSEVGEAISTMSTCVAGSMMATVSSTVTANIPVSSGVTCTKAALAETEPQSTTLDYRFIVTALPAQMTKILPWRHTLIWIPVLWRI